MTDKTITELRRLVDQIESFAMLLQARTGDAVNTADILRCIAQIRKLIGS
jgi:hypothetical protein